MKLRSDTQPFTRLCGFVGATVLGNPSAYAAALAVTLSVGVSLFCSRQVHHDAAWLLIATGRLLDGARLYVDDVIETNPPLILYLYTPAVLLGRSLGVSLPGVLNATVLALTLGSITVCNRALAAVLGAGRDRLRFALLVVLTVLGCVTVGEDFGQRDHILWLLLVPYLLLVAARMQGVKLGPKLARIAGVGGGIAVSLKPHYLLAMAVLELALALRRGSWRTALRPEARAGIAVGMLYIAAILAFTPEYLALARSFLVDSYWGLSVPLAWIVRPGELVLIAVCGAAAFAVRRRERVGDLAWTLLLATASFYGAMLIQHTGWVYHRIPFRCAAILLLALTALELVPGFARAGIAPLGRGARIAGATAAALATAASLLLQPDISAQLRWGARWRAGETASPIDRLTAVIDRHATGGSVLFLTLEMTPLPAMSYCHATWASRFSSLWPLAAVVRAQRGTPDVPTWFTDARGAALERSVRDAVIADLERYRPELIFVDLQRRNRLYGPEPFDILAFFRQDPRFEAVWSRYQPAPRSVGSFAYAVRQP
ncbi:MAG: hypothetical protein ACE5FL_14020 [Myxococcota bacterium]